MSMDVARGNGAPGDREGLLARMAELAGRFTPILLEEIGQAELLRRYDKKYAVAGSALPELLQRALGHYRVLEVQGLRLSPYETVYYDTPGLDLYHAHYERRFPRAKVRVRTYQDTGSRFLETKVRESRRWSAKERWPLDRVPPHLLVAPAALPPLDVTRGPVHLVPVVTVRYFRLTLVARNTPEHVTVDVGLRMEREGEATSYPSAAIVEVKLPAPGPSPMADVLASLRYRALGLSKYCVGIAALGNDARTARFQPLVHHLEHLGSSHGERAKP